MITADLIGAGLTPMVQIVVSATPTGEAWEVIGSTVDGYTWTVPGGRGVGDGGQLTLVDNRSPLNVPVTYAFSSVSVMNVSAPVVVPVIPPALFAPGGGSMVLQSLDGQKSVVVGVLKGSLEVHVPAVRARFSVPGRRRPVVRYGVSGDREGTLRLLVLGEDETRFEALFESGEPLLWRCTGPVFDLPAVAVFDFDTLTAEAFVVRKARVWSFPYVPVDDPFMDQRLGAFTWDFIDALQVDGVTVIRDGVAMEAAFAGLTWDQADAFDWSVLA